MVLVGLLDHVEHFYIAPWFIDLKAAEAFDERLLQIEVCNVYVWG